MRCRRSVEATVDGSPHAVFGGCIAGMLKLRVFVIGAAATAVAKVAGRPWSGIVIRQVDATVVPWVTVSVEASGRLDRDQRRLGHVARAILEE